MTTQRRVSTLVRLRPRPCPGILRGPSRRWPVGSVCPPVASRSVCRLPAPSARRPGISKLPTPSNLRGLAVGRGFYDPLMADVLDPKLLERLLSRAEAEWIEFKLSWFDPPPGSVGTPRRWPTRRDSLGSRAGISCGASTMAVTSWVRRWTSARGSGDSRLSSGFASGLPRPTMSFASSRVSGTGVGSW